MKHLYDNHSITNMQYNFQKTIKKNGDFPLFKRLKSIIQSFRHQ